MVDSGKSRGGIRRLTDTSAPGLLPRTDPGARFDDCQHCDAQYAGRKVTPFATLLKANL